MQKTINSIDVPKTLIRNGYKYTLDLSWSDTGFKTKEAAKFRAQADRERGFRACVQLINGLYYLYTNRFGCGYFSIPGY